MVDDEDLLLALLNSAPVVDGAPTEELAGRQGDAFARTYGGTTTVAERLVLHRMRSVLHDLVQGRDEAFTHLDILLDGAVLVPRATQGGLRWDLEAPADKRLAVRAAVAWSRVSSESPGRLRPCANADCNLFLIDHSRPGTARWCSMAVCGNRMKARAHARRARP